jgi:hypothetical protein
VTDQKTGPESNRLVFKRQEPNSPESSKVETTKAESQDNNKLEAVHQTVTKLANQLEFGQINEYVQLMNRPWKVMSMNFLGGIARGVGIAIGFTIFASSIVYVLQALGALDLPIIGDYIADIVKHVQNQLEGTRYY